MEGATASQPAVRRGSDGTARSAAGDSFELRRPADGSVIRSLPIDPPERVAEVVARVRDAQPHWEAIGIGGRRRWLECLRDWMIDNDARLPDVMQEETGEGRAEAEIEAPFL